MMEVSIERTPASEQPWARPKEQPPCPPSTVGEQGEIEVDGDCVASAPSKQQSFVQISGSTPTTEPGCLTDMSLTTKHH